MAKIVARIKGGLGNQLFCYAAARRLACATGAELVIDHVTGFARDRQYKRQYMLDHFHISARKATACERLEPFERYRRGVAKLISRQRPFLLRSYLEQEEEAFDPRLLALQPSGTIYLDGLWQSERYFKDVEGTIRADLRITPPEDPENQRMAAEMSACESVALHVRWFGAPGSGLSHNISAGYYHGAVAALEKRVDSPHYFLFSDDPEAACAKLDLPAKRVTCVAHNRGDEHAYADLWLMTRCRHFIIANSTFSWWGAWLGAAEHKTVIAPEISLSGAMSWGFDGLIPEGWELLRVVSQ